MRLGAVIFLTGVGMGALGTHWLVVLVVALLLVALAGAPPDTGRR